MGVFYFYVAAIGFALGIFVRSFWAISLPEIAFLLVLSLGLAVGWRKGSAASFAPALLTLSLLILAIALGALRFEVASWQSDSSQLAHQLDQSVALTGVVTREPDVREQSTHLYVKTNQGMILVITDRYSAVTYGDEVAVEGKLSKPEVFETDLGRTFNYPGYLEARGVSYTISFAAVEVVAEGRGNPVMATLLQGKKIFMQSIEAVLPEPQVGLAEGLLLGVKRALGEELETAFRKTGIIHIVVLSGYNVMLVVAFVTYVLAFLIPLRARLVFGLLAIIAFALMVGLSATVVRASIMAALILIARATNRIYMVMRALLLAGVVMLLINPYLLAFDTGFQLSFVATLGLILVAPHLESRLTLMPSSIGLREFLTATLATQIFVTPILLYQIGEFSVVAVVVNLLVLPMVPVAMLLTFVTGLVGLLSLTLATPLAYLTYLSLSYILLVATFFAALPFASYVVPAFPFWVVLLGYGLLAGGLWWLYQRSTNFPENHNLSGWLIEDESELSKSVSKAGDSVNEPPVFFR